MRIRMAIETVVAILVLSCACATRAAAEERSLYWKSLAVEARLDADGRLHVREVQEMVFTGAWNGGERQFRIRPGQDIQVTGLYELDVEHGTRRDFAAGSLARVGEFRWFPHGILRWRSRLPQDEPFHHAVRTYEIDYVLSRIVSRAGSGYVLDHDFAFPDRSGAILEFSRTLELDPSWQLAAPVETTLRRAAVSPGMSDVEHIELRYVGAGEPAAVAGLGTELARPGSHRLAIVLVCTLAALIVGYTILLFTHEQRRGRFASLLPIESIDERWLNVHVFTLPAEVVGATWDRKTSTHEVAAVLARMATEEKLSSHVQSEGIWIFGRDVLHMDLTCDVASLKGYERELIEKLFLGKRSTSTTEIRKHYRNSGFDPLRLVRPSLEQKVSRVLGEDEKLARWHWVLTLTLLIAGAAACVAGAILWTPSAPFTAITACVTTLLMIAAKTSARSYRLAPVATFAAAGRVLVLVTAAVVALAWAFSMFELPTLAFIGLALVAAGLLNSTYNGMRSRESPAAVETRNRLASARRYFAHQLAVKSPQLKDSWLPYILGFGLGPNVDRWFKSYGASDGTATTLTSHSGVGSSSSLSSSSWTGGGTFGGAGASGTWVSAIGGIAGGVTAASSGSSSSGGGGGGGSSGGGGGGGW
jgi:uncharacterized membrane protein YgcG